MSVSPRRIKYCGVTHDQLVLSRLKAGQLKVELKSGAVFSTINGKTRRIGREITDGYRQIKLTHDTASGESCAHQIMEHRVVVIAATGKPIPAGYHVDHKNEVHGDNRVDNLQVLTPAQNLARRKEPGKKKLAAQQREEVRRLIRLAVAQNHIARKFGVTQGAIAHYARRMARGEAA